MAEKRIVPARSWTGGTGGVAGTQRWIVLGPMALGSWFRRMQVSVYAPGVGRVSFCPVLTSVGEPNVAALAAGRALVDVGGLSLYNKGALLWTSWEGLSLNFHIYVGLRIETDARWLVCMCTEEGGLQNAGFNVSAELVRLE